MHESVISYQTHPSQYRHWKLVLDGPIATLLADFDENADHYVAWPVWLPAGDRLTVQWMNRGQDNIKIFSVDPETGKKEEVFEEKQPAWVEFFEDLYFFKDGSGFLLRRQPALLG
jgi:dipeptidyl-peptidase-4